MDARRRPIYQIKALLLVFNTSNSRVYARLLLLIITNFPTLIRDFHAIFPIHYVADGLCRESMVDLGSPKNGPDIYTIMVEAASILTFDAQRP